MLLAPIVYMSPVVCYVVRMPATTTKRIAIVGATGVVGQTMIRLLEDRRFQVEDFVPIATDASADTSVGAFGDTWTVRALREDNFKNVDIAFFTAGAKASLAHVPAAIENGCRVIDNTTAFRMSEDTPLVVPEINGELITEQTRLVACPNCTAIVLVMTLAPLLRRVPIERVVVTSFQSVSGAGRDALTEMESQVKYDLANKPPRAEIFTKPIAYNCLPQVGKMTSSGGTVEEEKIIEETRKILAAPELHVVATAVRVPVRVGHAISVNIETKEPLGVDEAKSLWNAFDGVRYDEGLPTQRDIEGTDTVVVGRARRDASRPHAISYWAVGDNIRKGAATNSVQIAELFLKQ